MKFLACCVLPDKKLHGNCLYWCKYVRDFDGAMQWLKATIPDRSVWLPPPACVIVAMRLSKALKDAHSKRQEILVQSSLHTAFTKPTSKFSYCSQSAIIKLDVSWSMLQQNTEEFWESTKNLALKLLLIKKIYHLNNLHLYPSQTRKWTKKELLNSYIKLLTFRHPIGRFLQKRSKSLSGLIQIKVIITIHDFGPDCTLR